VFSSRRIAHITLPDLDEQDPGWDAVLRELATEPDLDFAPAPARAKPVTVDLPASGSRPFGGLLDLLLVLAAIVTGIIVTAVGVAAFAAS
jgi:hypothetical protein